MSRVLKDQESTVVRILILAFLTVAIHAGRPAEAGWTITQLTDNSTHDMWPAISGTNVVWYGWDGSDYAVYSNFAGKLANTNFTNLNFLGSAGGPAVSGTNVVWVSYDGHDSQITTNFAGQLTHNNYNNYMAHMPDISGTNVVWVDWFQDSAGLGFDLNSNFAGRLTTNSGMSYDKTTAISGTNVVWQAGGDGIHSNFGAYWGPGYYGRADISGENVAWTYGDAFTNFSGQLTSGGNRMNAAISGTNVAWVEMGGTLETNFGGSVPGFNYYYYMGSMSDPDISGMTIVWNGPDMSGEPDQEIYMATYTSEAVPAPGAVLLAGIGVGLAGWMRRRRAW